MSADSETTNRTGPDARTSPAPAEARRLHISPDLEYIRRCYRVDATVGGSVVLDGRPGIILGANDAHLVLRLDGEQHPALAHPTWRMTYLPAAGTHR